MKRVYHFTTALSVLFFAVNPLSAAPEQGDSKRQDIFQQLDKNSDGTVTADEVPKDKERFFDHLIRSGDKNKDGKLSQDEFQSGLKKEEQKFHPEEGPKGKRDPRAFQMMLNRLDKNRDKKISKDELPERLRDRLEPLFKRLNKEEISLEEFGQYLNRFRGKQEGAPQRMAKTNIEGAERFFNTLDKNKDGKLTLDEAPERGKQILRRILERSGKEPDSELSKKEFIETVVAFRPRRGPEGRPGDKEMKRPEMRDKENRGRDSSMKGRPIPALMVRLDTNRDGKLSKDELKNIGQVFDQLDQNKDGALDLEEMWIRGDRSTNSFRRSSERPKEEGKRRSDAEKKDSP